MADVGVATNFLQHMPRLAGWIFILKLFGAWLEKHDALRYPTFLRFFILMTDDFVSGPGLLPS